MEVMLEPTSLREDGTLEMEITATAVSFSEK